MSTETVMGRFVWHELMTKDVKAARAFYTELLGWQVKEVDMGPEKYHLILVGERDIGGLVPMDQKAEHPSHWIGYVTVGNADAAAERATRLGGRVAVPPMDIPGVGRFAVIGDPHGAYTSAFQYTRPQKPEPERYEPGMFCWDELLTKDPAQARAFYSELYGWSVSEMNMGPMTYHMFKSGGKDRAGMMQMPGEDMGPPHWLHYVLVTDLDASFAKAQKLGAKVYVPPMDIPNIGRFTVIADPSGAAVGLFKGQG